MTFRILSRNRRSMYPAVSALKCFLIIIALSFLAEACYQGTNFATRTSTSPQSVTPIISTPQSASPTLTTQPVFMPTATQVPYKVWLAPYLPEKLRSTLALSDAYSLATTPEEADIAVIVDDQGLPPGIQWTYALVAPFPTITDGISFDELQADWNGSSTLPFNGAPLLMDGGTYEILSAYWGSSAAGSVEILPADQLLEYAWSHQPSWAIIPFEMLEPRWKVLTVNGQSPIRKDFDPAAYLLNIPFVITGNINLAPDVLNLPATNRDPNKLTTVAITGVTAMVRATAFTMENKGITYPAQDIGSLLSQADITHISNEIPFTPDCPFPDPVMPDLVFCSNPRYIDLLKAVGTDVVELTGDHFMDYGADATLYTLQMYKDLGWSYYGGGADAADARKPALFENNGNKIAFMGCNIGCQVKNEIPCDATATDEHPGANLCDFNAISSEIPALRDQGYNVIFTFQHREYYTYTTEPILANDFGLVSSDGATIVSGSQAHQPHGFAFQNGSFIHYGLGNLFFDQYHYCVNNACDDAFIDRHVFYDGKYISTELITIHFVDYARPRLMTPDERQRFLKIIFNASGW